MVVGGTGLRYAREMTKIILAEPSDHEHIIGLTGKRRVFMLVGTPDESFDYCPKCGEKLDADPS